VATSDVGAALPVGTVSFLFTDVVRSTSLLTTLDRSRYASLLEAERAAVDGAVAAHQGSVVDRAGDGILAAFASAGDALAAAAAAQRTLASTPASELVAVRMGLDTGDVLLRGGTYIGIALHRGARICALAGGGCVLMSATTRELVGDELPEAVELRDLGAVILPGFPDRTQLYQAVLPDLPASAVHPRLPHTRESRLLDRDVELALLTACLQAAQRGVGDVVSIEGTAGIGKTSLLEAARQIALGRDLAAVVARASELETGYPFGVVRQLFERELSRAADPDTLFAGAAQPARSIFNGEHSESVGDGFAILHALYWLTVNLAEQRPLLLAVDDIQWCDAPSLRYLAYLVPRVDDLPIFLLTTRRVGEQPADEQALDVISSDASTTRIVPGGLGVHAVRELLRHALGTEPDPVFVTAAREATAANPLLVRELARALATAGVSPTADAVTAIPELGPGAVSRFVLRRLERLGQPARALAESVAVLGDGCTLAVAANHADLTQAVAADAAGSLALAELLAAGTPLRFVHPLVRAAVYQQLRAGERATAHARAAAVLRSEGDAIRVGLHLLHAPPGSGDEETIRALRAAARAAELDGAPESAAAFLGRILEEPLQPAARADTLLALGSVELRFDHRQAGTHLRDALRDLPHPDEQARAALLLGRALYIGGEHADAVAVLDNALAFLPDPQTDVAYRIEAELIGPLSELHDDARVVELLAHVHRRTLRGDDLGRRMLVAQTAASLALPLAREEYVRLAHEAVRDDLLLEDETSDIYVWATVGLSAADELRAAREALDRAITYGRRRGSVHLLATALQFRARVQHLLGDLASAEVDARAGLAALDLHPLPTTLRYLAAALADVLIDRGLTDEAVSTLDSLPPLTEGPEARVVLYSRSELALATGRAGDALPLLDELAGPADLDELAGPRVGQRRWLVLKAQTLSALGRTDEASSLAAAEIERARVWGAPRALARSLRIAALAAPVDRRVELLTEALAVVHESPAMLERAHVLGALGSATRRAGRRADAREFLREGLELAHVCGATPLARMIQDELLVAGARPRRVRLSGVEALTPSELRVARLAAQGRANREIAQELFVTLKTVEMHLASSYRKLGITSRSKLAGLLEPEPQG
jgi:class 3 adenylate cyclase/DNA-binding CsgD family transcriptional regulator